MRMASPRRILCSVALAASVAHGFYLPGVAPTEWKMGEMVDLKVNKLTSSRTQLPYDYYTLPFCQPEVIKEKIENLGEILTGDAIRNSPYRLKMQVNQTCKFLCQKTLTKEEKEKFRKMIDEEYMASFIVDNIPAAIQYQRDPQAEPVYVTGFPIGSEDKGKYQPNTHLTLLLDFHQNKEKYEGSRIVGFEVRPSSLKVAVTQGVRPTASCTSGIPYDLDSGDDIVYTYDVLWRYSDVRWASRWDHYLRMSGGQIHWFSILNSCMIVLFLTGLIGMILVRTLLRDISKYNEIATAEETAEETGWKLVHADVFRQPPYAPLFCTCVGSGVQFVLMSVVVMVFAVFGFLSPARRGALLQSMMILFTFMGCFAGYTATRLYKLFGGEQAKLTALMTALLFPGIFFVVFFFLNLFIWGEKSSGAVPFTTMFALLVLWFGISMPLVFLGAYLGMKKEVIEVPVRTNQIPRQIPVQPWYARDEFVCSIAGILPFGAVFTELFFIMSSIWMHQFYYLFGFLALVLFILLVTCAELSIALTYFQLTTENYHWYWRSFLSCASCGVYVFLYSAIYFKMRLNIVDTIPTILYFGYMGLMALLFFLVTGSAGFISSFWFVKAIYGSIKVD